MRTNDLVSLYVSFVETNGGKSRPVLIRRVLEQTVEAFKITSQYEKKLISSNNIIRFKIGNPLGWRNLPGSILVIFIVFPKPV